MLTARVTVGQAGLGAGYELRSIAAAVIGGAVIGGGKGRLSGVFLGVALMTCLTVGLAVTGVGTFQQQMAIGIALVVAVLISQLRGGSFRQVSDLLPTLKRLFIGFDGRSQRIANPASATTPKNDDTV